MLTLILGIVPALILVDQVVKTYVENHVVKGSEKKILKDKVLIRKVYNKGMCLNVLEDHPDMVKTTSVLVTILLTLYTVGSAYFQKHRVAENVGLSLMTAGAWSNTLDRCLRNYVVDYFGFEAKKEKIRRITYNLGDMFIFAGAIITALAFIFHREK